MKLSQRRFGLIVGLSGIDAARQKIALALVFEFGFRECGFAFATTRLSKD